jgi:hypothetical protein
MSILDATTRVPPNSLSPAATAQTGQPTAKGAIPPELLKLALNMPAGLHGPSYGQGLVDGHAAALAAGATAGNALTPAQAMQTGK